MAGKLFQKKFKNTFLSKNEKDKEEEKVNLKSATPTPLKQTLKTSSVSSLYASTPALSSSDINDISQATPTTTQTTSRLKIVRDFFRNRFNINNKTANKQMTQSNITTRGDDTTPEQIDDLKQQQKVKTKAGKNDIANNKSKQKNDDLKLVTANIKERLIKSKLNDKNNLIDAISEDEGISKTPDSLKNVLNTQKKLNTNINKNSSFGYSSESFASIGSIDSNNNIINDSNNNQIDSIKTPKSANLVDNSIQKAKIHAAAYRNLRKAGTKKRIGQQTNEANKDNVNNNDHLKESFIMDPIEETTKRDDSYDNTNNNSNLNENNNNNDNAEDNVINDKDAFKKMLTQQIKQHLNKSNPQLDKPDTVVTQLPPPGPSSNELLEKHKSNLKSVKLKDHQAQIQQQISNEIKLIKRNSIKNSSVENTVDNTNHIKRNNSIDLNLIDSTTNNKNEGSKRSSLILNSSLTKSEEPIYDNLVVFRQSSGSKKSFNKRNSIDSLNLNKTIESDSLEKGLNQQEEPVSSSNRSSVDSKKRANTTIITSHTDITNSNNNNAPKLGHSKSLKIVDTTSNVNTNTNRNSLISPSAHDIGKNQLNTKNENKVTNTPSEPVWRELALKKQSAWINHENDNNGNRNMAASCMPAIESSSQNEEKIQSNRFGKVKSLISNLEK